MATDLTAGPAPADPIATLLTSVEGLARELQNVRVSVDAEERTRARQIEEEADSRKRAGHRFLVIVAVDLAFSVLIAFGYHGIRTTQNTAASEKHRQAVASCESSDSARAGIRKANDTTFSVLASLVPPNPPPATVALINRVHQAYEAADAAVPNVDCSKLP